jgi:hypothetical protein
LVGLALCAGAVACAAAAEAPSGVRSEAAEPKPMEYERILTSFPADPDLIVFLDPWLCARYCDEELGDGDFDLLAASFGRIGARRAQAAARLNQAAMLWSMGDGDAAYLRAVEAQTHFAAMGDVEGLAHSLEWLGYMFRASGEGELAAEQLSLAFRMFRALGNEHGAARVLSYAD